MKNIKYIQSNIKSNYSHTIFMFKSKSLRLKTGCSFSSRMMMISPGSIPGSWSPSLENGIFWPSFIPLSMWTSRILRSFTVFLPWQVLQRSFSETKEKDKQNLYLITEDPRAQGTEEVRMAPFLPIKRWCQEGWGLFFNQKALFYIFIFI